MERGPGDRGRRCVLQIIKEEWKNVKSSVLRYHRELRREQGEGWIQSLRTELEPSVQCLLREDWKEVAKKYLHKLEEAREIYHNTTKERDQEGEDKKEGESKKEDNTREKRRRKGDL